MLNNKWELTNWAPNTKHKNTNWHQNLSQKSSKNPIFVVRKWAPQEVVLFLTLEVVPKLTLERPKSGTKTNSPAYIYIYSSHIIYIYMPTASEFTYLFPSQDSIIAILWHVGLDSKHNIRVWAGSRNLSAGGYVQFRGIKICLKLR